MEPPVTQLRRTLAPLNGRSVFVTGHTGFKGSWLALWLAELGARVTGFSLAPPSEPNHFTVAGVRDVLADHHHGDIRDADALARAMRAARPDLVLHLAAQSVVREGYDRPRDTFDVNVMGTIGVLEAVRALHASCAVVCVTSDKCYRNDEQVWGYREHDALGEHDPYGGSKGAAEIAIRSWRHSFFPPERESEHGVRLASARAGNVIGGGDWKRDALIVDVVRALAAGRPVELRNPGAFRPWQHVLQALSGYLALSVRLLTDSDPRWCDAWNFGPVPGNELPVREVVEIFQREWGTSQQGWRDVSGGAHPREAHILRLCIDKALWELDWRPGWDVSEVLARTAHWYRLHAEGATAEGATPDGATPESAAMREVSLAQIRDYERGPTPAGANVPPPTVAPATVTPPPDLPHDAEPEHA